MLFDKMLFAMVLLRNRRAALLGSLAIPVALFFAMRAKLSWRPRVIGRMHNGITALAWSPDGKWLACAAGDTTTWGTPSEIGVWSVQNEKLQSRFSLAGTPLSTLRFSSDSQKLIGIDLK
jgi:WD40 repeat protein